MRTDVFALLLIVVAAANAGDCQVGWTEYHDRCYFMGEGRLSFTSAKLACRALGANLIEIDNQMEDRFFSNKFLLTGDMWLGMTGVNGTWTLVSGTPASHLNWVPSSIRQNDNVCAKALVNDLGHWIEAPCDSQQMFVCEKPLEEDDDADDDVNAIEGQLLGQRQRGNIWADLDSLSGIPSLQSTRPQHYGSPPLLPLYLYGPPLANFLSFYQPFEYPKLWKRDLQTDAAGEKRSNIALKNALADLTNNNEALLNFEPDRVDADLDNVHARSRRNGHESPFSTTAAAPAATPTARLSATPTARPSAVASPVRPSAVASPVRPSTTASPVRPSTTASPVRPSTTASPVRPSAAASPIGTQAVPSAGPANLAGGSSGYDNTPYGSYTPYGGGYAPSSAPYNSYTPYGGSYGPSYDPYSSYTPYGGGYAPSSAPYNSYTPYGGGYAPSPAPYNSYAPYGSGYAPYNGYTPYGGNHGSSYSPQYPAYGGSSAPYGKF